MTTATEELVKTKGAEIRSLALTDLEQALGSAKRIIQMFDGADRLVRRLATIVDGATSALSLFRAAKADDSDGGQPKALTGTTTTTTPVVLPSATVHRGRAPNVWRTLSGDAVRDYRESNHISRAKLAQTLDVSPTSVQNWETGIATPTEETQRKLEVLINGGVSTKMGTRSSAAPKKGLPTARSVRTGRKIDGEDKKSARAVAHAKVKHVCLGAKYGCTMETYGNTIGRHQETCPFAQRVIEEDGIQMPKKRNRGVGRPKAKGRAKKTKKAQKVAKTAAAAKGGPSKIKNDPKHAAKVKRAMNSSVDSAVRRLARGGRRAG